MLRLMDEYLKILLYARKQSPVLPNCLEAGRGKWSMPKQIGPKIKWVQVGTEKRSTLCKGNASVGCIVKLRIRNKLYNAHLGLTMNNPA